MLFLQATIYNHGRDSEIQMYDINVSFLLNTWMCHMIFEYTIYYHLNAKVLLMLTNTTTLTQWCEFSSLAMEVFSLSFSASSFGHIMFSFQAYSKDDSVAVIQTSILI